MKTLKRYLITLGVEVLSVLFVILLKDIFHASDAKTVFHILCDAFFAVGFVTAGVGLMVFTTNEGVFDGLVYGVSSFINMFKKDSTQKYKTLYDYKASRSKKELEFGYIVICGLAFLLVGLVMFIFYSRQA